MDLAAAIATAQRDRGQSWVSAELVSIDTTANLAYVRILGSHPIPLPFLPNTYTGVNVVMVARDRNGAYYVQGPLGSVAQVDLPQAAPTPPAADAPQPATVQDTALILPVWSGTWRSIRGDWDRWNVNRYGGRSTLYQGNAYGSGPLTGLAVYGSQVQALGAVSIDRIDVSLPLVTGGGTAVVQGSAQGSAPSGAPTTTGATASGVPSTKVTLPGSVAEGFRTGALKGLALVGADYLAVSGRGGGMALAVTYTRPA